MKKSLILVFPGTNCEKETLFWIQNNLETDAEFLNLTKHSNLTHNDIDFIIIPGGFSYGDYLRAGAIAARSPEMKFISDLASKNTPVLGICNGFQILCESKLLAGTLIKNVTQQHHHFPVELNIDIDFFIENSNKNCIWLPKVTKSNLEKFNKRFSNFVIPMSCSMGNWRPPLIEKNKQKSENLSPILYVNNENGSYNSIASLTNINGNILGLMPHPERASEYLLGSVDGLLFLYGIAENKKIKIKEGSELWKFARNF